MKAAQEKQTADMGMDPNAVKSFDTAPKTEGADTAEVEAPKGDVPEAPLDH